MIISWQNDSGSFRNFVYRCPVRMLPLLGGKLPPQGHQPRAGVQDAGDARSCRGPGVTLWHQGLSPTPVPGSGGTGWPWGPWWEHP